MHTIKIVDVVIPYTQQKRKIRIYLPPSYTQSKVAYPVIYMHDAQNLFDKETSSYGAIWDIHEHLNALSKTQAFIVVGIDNYEGRHNRLDEYSPWVNQSLKSNTRFEDITSDVGGLGEQYMDFLVSVLKPKIDSEYRTLKDAEHTAIIGSSMGGLISLYAGMKYPDVFSKVAAFSTAVWFAEEPLLKMMQTCKSLDQVTWYLDIGTKETDDDKFNQVYLNGTLKVHETLKEDVHKNNLHLTIDEGGIHNEVDWSRRFPTCMKFLFNLK